jgi:hypothetical protein
MGSAPARGAYAPRGSHGGARAPRGPYGGAYTPRGGYGGATVRPGGSPPGSRSGAAPYRHPRAGTGSGSYYYYGPGRGHGGHYGRYYGGYYRPYYPYYRPYYGYYGSPYAYGSVYLGWPWYSTWPYYSGGYSTSSYTYAPPYYYDDGTYPEGARSGDVALAPRTSPPDRSTAVVVGGGQIRLEVRPDDASVYVDDAFRGTARDVRLLDLAPGRHRIELVRPGFAIASREVDVVKGERADLFVELQRR